MYNDIVTVKREEKEFISIKGVINGEEKKRYYAYYVELAGAKIYLDLPTDLKKLVNLGGELAVIWDKVAKYKTAYSTLNWHVAPSKSNDELFGYLFAKQMEMDLLEGDEE